MSAKVSLKQLQALEAVARNGSFTQAARELGVSQPTVSNLIYTLERQFNCRMLDRSGNTITPTEQFTEIGGHIKSVLALSDTITRHLTSGRDLVTGRFEIGYSVHQIAIPIIADFVRSYPDLQVNACGDSAQDLLQDLRNGQLDVAFVTAQELPVDLAGVEICETRIGLAVPISDPLSQKPSFNWHDVANLPLILRMPGSGSQKIFDATARRRGLPPARGLRFGAWCSALSLVQQKVGLAISLERECEGETDVRFVPINDPLLMAKQFLVCQQALRDTAPIQRFLETASAHAKGQAEKAAQMA
ncbi:LysR family transcriptional regulator [Epibacterium ulvae]|uniref:LysR family transcriptional regulator n=1 Tax=Epibacterium ulvae TaxID=1156985 RepID=UPI001BFCAB52|nr:LysR family transcriptional regulator [Epibacterium ulvae]MBT8155637.1 LysR family transcriptional regulator [Epibacterium ulvae]